MQSDSYFTPHSSASIQIDPSGNVASRVNLYSHDVRSASSSGESSPSPSSKDAPTKFNDSPPSSVTVPVSSSTDLIREVLSPENIVVVSPCPSTDSTMPNAIIEPRSRHSFKLRNATDHETLFIGFAHLFGAKRATSLASCLQWKFDHPVANLLAVAEQLEARREVRSKIARL